MAGTVCILVWQVTEGLGKNRFKPWLVRRDSLKNTIWKFMDHPLFFGDYASGWQPECHLLGSGYLTQRELCRLGLPTTVLSLGVFMIVDTGWILLVAR